jgi:hypothetical protein
MQAVSNTVTLLTPLQQLQKRYAIVDLNGAFYAVDLVKIASASGELALYTRSDAKIAFIRFLETLPYDSDSSRTIAEFWKSPSTTLYDSVSFSPTNTVTTSLNLWKGPTVTATKGTPPAIILEHLRDVLCGGDPVKFDYLIRYLAHMLQKPKQKPGVMPVLISKEGAGKGAFFKLIRRIWGNTSFITSNIDDVVGRFNSPIERSFVVLLDEAQFAGDKKSRDRMKSLITEDAVRIEAKNQPTRQIASHHRFFSATNHKHFANIDSGDRRHFYLFLSEHRIKDRAYFDRLFSILENDIEIGRFVEHLLGIDLTGYRPWDLPEDRQKDDQLLRSLTGFDEYYYSRLLSGIQIGAYGTPWADPTFVSTHALTDDCKSHASGRSRPWDMSTQSLVSRLKELCPSATYTRITSNNQQKRGFSLPSLDVARTEFCDAMGVRPDWGD